ncbi:MAG: hypothetical protein LBN22_06525 [Clostridiales Family XIII bacterium]|jgi:hypothetical protein|nr:hypothetical protein [Clostridiales Family XIII bacterium]
MKVRQTLSEDDYNVALASINEKTDIDSKLTARAQGIKTKIDERKEAERKAEEQRQAEAAKQAAEQAAAQAAAQAEVQR